MRRKNIIYIYIYIYLHYTNIYYICIHYLLTESLENPESFENSLKSSFNVFML